MLVRSDNPGIADAQRFAAAASMAFWISASLLAGIGCAAEESSVPIATATFEQRDSAGVGIRETSGDVLRSPLPWLVDAAPDLEIGVATGDEPYEFSDISGLALLADGAVVVVDAGSRTVRWFDSEGEFVRMVGRRGQGPGDFVEPRLIPQWGADSLLIFDPPQGRLTAIGLNGEWHRTHLPSAQVRSLFRGREVGAVSDRVLFRTPGGGCPFSGPDGVCEVLQILHALDPVEGTADTLAITTARLFRTTEFGGSFITDIPFDPLVSGAVGSRGFLLAHGERFEIEEFDRNGDLSRIIRVDHPPAPLEEEILDTFIREYPRGRLPESAVRGMFGQMDIRSAEPTFRSLRVDSLGWIWAELFAMDDPAPTEWVVFDPSGHGRGVLELPRGFEVHDIGEEFVVGVVTDAMGIEYVGRYRLDRNAR